MFASLGLDLFGLLGVTGQPIGIGILVGAVAVLIGITIVLRGAQKSQRAQRAQGTPAPGTSDKPAGRVGWLVAVLPVQGAVNAQLRGELGEPLAVGVISFIVATTAIAVVLLILLLLKRTPTPKLAQLGQVPWWGWLGGACAAVYVTATFLIIPAIGAFTTIALTVTGQQLASALIDHFGLFRLPRRALNTGRLSGLGLLVAGSLAIQLL